MTREVRGGIIESEWVYTGAAFALNHPISQHLGAVWLVVIWVALHAGLGVLGVINLTMAGLGPFTMLFALLLVLLVLNDLFAILTLIGRHPLAWYPVWLCLICTFPLSLPLIMYWSDGARPNLIYRHRFGRLVFPDAGEQT